MTLIRRKKPQAETTQLHYGFREDGSSFQSKDPIDNIWTRAVWDLCRQIQQLSLRPDEAVHHISKLSERVQSCFHCPTKGNFSTVLAQWSSLSRYRDWAVVWVGSPVLSTVKYRGAGVPLFPDDEQKWRERCRMAERIHSEEPDTTKPFNLDAFIRSLPAKRLSDAEKIANAMAKERDRQLAIFKENHPEVP